SFYDAYLVASYRDERGVPRQRTICYLGNIRQIGDEFPMIERELFLLRAERILLSIAELGEVDREEALDALRQKVPPLTREEVMTAFVENLRWYRRWWEQNGGGPTDDELIKIVQLARGRLGPV
ncbi:MAG: hypothetical protein EOM24_04100, partial [Chloroflexia bacterium]|nr:hypothetical protein [Chloroflexia bacterium]